MIVAEVSPSLNRRRFRVFPRMVCRVIRATSQIPGPGWRIRKLFRLTGVYAFFVQGFKPHSVADWKTQTELAVMLRLID
jgi:hypothetical protein